MIKHLNLFYEEAESDRWFKCDRFPRRIIRRIVRGKPRTGGQTRVFLNLCAGLDKLNVPYRVNDYRYIQRHQDEVACIIGKPQILDKIRWQNPILFGASVFSHPIEDPDIIKRLPIQKIVVPGEWMRKMFAPYYGDRVLAWPVGIDTDEWTPTPIQTKDIDILLYDKVRWEYDRYEAELINPIQLHLRKLGLKVGTIRYGFYREEDFRSLLNRSKAMIFLCEHETQGIAYQQALSCGVPILAWDRGGFWQDPSYFPSKVKFAPVSSVPYWDDCCGIKFQDINDFSKKLAEFLHQLNCQQFYPRDYILEHLTLEKSAKHYLEILHKVQTSPGICDTGKV
jgi:glycosyltransferase involved in cell wall biosynthesis